MLGAAKSPLTVTQLAPANSLRPVKWLLTPTPATMPITLIDYTSYDEIRAVLGVSDEELEDSTLSLPMYLTTLTLGLGDIDTTLETQYLTLKAATTLTPKEQKLLDVVSVFSAYAVAQHLLTSMPLFAPKRITDGRAETDRVTDPFKDVRLGVNHTYASLKARLSELLEIPVASTRIYFGAVGLAINPVTSL